MASKKGAQVMGPIEISERMKRDVKAIERKLNRTRKEAGDYAEAYGEVRGLLLVAALDVAKLDPSFGLDSLDVATGDTRR